MSNLNDTSEPLDFRTTARIKSSLHLGADFTIARAKPWHAFATRHFNSPRVKTGDDAFDQDILIASDDPRVERAFQQSPEARRLVMNIMNFKARPVTWFKFLSPPAHFGSEIICKLGKPYIQIHPPHRKPFDSDPPWWTEQFKDCQPILDELILALLQAESDLANPRLEPSAGAGDLFWRCYRAAIATFALLAFWFFFWGMHREKIDWNISTSSWGAYLFILMIQFGFFFGVGILTHRRSTRLPLAMEHAMRFTFYSLFVLPILLPYYNAKLPSPYPSATFCATSVPYNMTRVLRPNRKHSPSNPSNYLSMPSQLALEQSGIKASDIDWIGIQFHDAWAVQTENQQRLTVTIQKGLLGVPLVRAIEVCKADCPCP